MGVGGIPCINHRTPVGPLHVGPGPVGSQGAQQQPRHDALSLLQVGQGAQECEKGVGAGVQQVVVPEGAQGGVHGAPGPQGHAPCLLLFPQNQWVFFLRHLANAGLRVVDRYLLPHHLAVDAAGHQRHAVGLSRQLQGEGLGDRYRLEQVLHTQQGALSGARRGDRQQHRGSLVAVVSKQEFLGVQLHRVQSFLYRCTCNAGASVVLLLLSGLPAGARSPLDHLGLLRRGLDAHREAAAPGQEQPVPPGAGEQPALQLLRQVEGVSHGAYGRGVLLQ